MALLRSVGIGFAKFLRAYLIVLVVGGVLAQMEFPYPNSFAPGSIAATLGALTGGAIGLSAFGTLLGLFIELGMTRKFEGRIFLYTAFAVMLLPPLVAWLADYLDKHPLS